MFPLDVGHTTIVVCGDPQFALLRIADTLEDHSTKDVVIDGWRVSFTSVRRTWARIEKRRMPIPSGWVSVEDAGPGLKRVRLQYNTTILALITLIAAVVMFLKADRGTLVLGLVFLAGNWLATLIGGLVFWKRVKDCF